MPLLNKCRLMEDFMVWKEYISSKFWLFFSISCLPMRTFTASLSMLVVIVGKLYDFSSNIFVQILIVFLYRSSQSCDPI